MFGRMGLMAKNFQSITESFDPSSISNLNLWVKSDEGVLDTSAGSISNGEEVGTWQDQSGNGYNLDREVVGFSDGPTYDDTTYAFPVLKFGETVTQVLSKNDGTVTIVDADSSVFMVCVSKEGGADPTGMFFSVGNGSEHLQVNSETAGVSANMRYKNNAAYAFTLPFDTLTGLQFDLDGTNGDIQGYVDGAQVFTNIYTNSSADGFTIGNSDGGVDSTGLHVAEVLVYGKLLSGDEVVIVEGYLASKYGISF